MTSNTHFNNFAALESWCTSRFLHPVVVVEASSSVELSALKNGLTFIQLLRPFSTCQGPILSRVDERKKQVITTTYPFGVRLVRSDCVHGLGDHLVAVSEEQLRHLLEMTASVLSATSSPDYGLLLDVLLQKALLQTPANEGRTARSPRLFQSGQKEGATEESIGLPLQLQHLQELYLSSSSWMGKRSEEWSGAPRQRPQYVSLKPTLIQPRKGEAASTGVLSDSLSSTEGAARTIPFTAGQASEKVQGRIVSTEIVPSSASTGSNARQIEESGTSSSTLNRAKSALPSRSISPFSLPGGGRASVAPKSASKLSELDMLMQGTVPAWYPSFLHNFFSLIRCGPMDTLDHPIGIIYAVSTREGLTKTECRGEGVTAANWKAIVLREIRTELVRQYNLVQSRVWPEAYASTMSTAVHSYFFLVHDDDHFSGVEMNEAECPALFPLSADDVGDLLMECQAITASMGIFDETPFSSEVTSRPSATPGLSTTPSEGVDSLKSKTIRCNSWMVVTLNSASLPLRPPFAPEVNLDTHHRNSSAPSSSSSSGAATSRSPSDGVDPLLWVRANPPSVDILGEEGLQRVASLSTSLSFSRTSRKEKVASSASGMDDPKPQAKLSFVTPHTREIENVCRVSMRSANKENHGGSNTEDGVGVKGDRKKKRSSVEILPRMASRERKKTSSYAITASISPLLYSTYCIPFPWTRKGVRAICGTWLISPPSSDPLPKGTPPTVPPSPLEYPMYTGCFLSTDNITDLQSIMTAYLAHHLAQFIQRHIAGLSVAIRLRRTTTLGKVTAWFRSENAKPKLELVTTTCRQRRGVGCLKELQDRSRPEGKRVSPEDELLDRGEEKEVLRFSAASIEMQMRRCADWSLFLQDFDYAETNYKLCCDELLETARTNKELVQPLLGAVQEGISLCQLFKKQVPHVLPSLPPSYHPTSVSQFSTFSPSDAVIPATDSLTNHKCSGGVCRLDVSLADYYHAYLSGQDELFPYIMRSSLLAFEMCRTHQHPSPAMDRAAVVLLRLLSTDIPKQQSHLWSAVIQQLLAGTYLCMNPPKPWIETLSFTDSFASKPNEDSTFSCSTPSQDTALSYACSPSQRTFPVLSHLRRYVYHMHNAGSRWFIHAAIDTTSAQAALYCYRRLFICCKALVHQEEVGLFGDEEMGDDGLHSSGVTPVQRAPRFLNCGLGNDALRLLSQTQRSGWRAMLDDITGKLIFLLSILDPHAFPDVEEAKNGLTAPRPPAIAAEVLPSHTVMGSPETERRAISRLRSRWERQVLDAEALAVVAYAISRNIRCHLDYIGKHSVWKDVHLLFELQRRCDLSLSYLWWCLYDSSPRALTLSREANRKDEDEGTRSRKAERNEEEKEEEKEKEHTRHLPSSFLSRPPPSRVEASGYMMLPIVDPHSLIMDVNYYKMDSESQCATQKAKECFGDLLDKEWQLAEEDLQKYFQRLLRKKWNTPEKQQKGAGFMAYSLPSSPLFPSIGTSPAEESYRATSPPCVSSPFVFPPYVGDASCMKVSIPDAKKRIERCIAQQQQEQEHSYHHGRINSSSSTCSLTFGSLNSPLYRSALEGSGTSFASQDTTLPSAPTGEKDQSHLFPPTSSAFVGGAASSVKVPFSFPSPLLFTVPQEQCIWLSVSMMNPLEVPLVVRDLALVYLIESEEGEGEGEGEDENAEVADGSRSPFKTRVGEASESTDDRSSFSRDDVSVPREERWPLHASLPVRVDGRAPPYETSLHPSDASATELEWNPFEKKRVRLPFYTGSLPTVPIQLIGLSWSLCVPSITSSSSATMSPRVVYEGRYYFATARQAGVPPVLLSPPPSLQHVLRSPHASSPSPSPPSEGMSTGVVASVVSSSAAVVASPSSFSSSTTAPGPSLPTTSPAQPMVEAMPSAQGTTMPRMDVPSSPLRRLHAPPSASPSHPSSFPDLRRPACLSPLLHAPEHIRFGVTPARASLTATFFPSLPLQMYDGEVFCTALRITNHAPRIPVPSASSASSPLPSRSALPWVGPYALQVTIQPSPHNAYVLCFPQRLSPSFRTRPSHSLASRRRGEQTITFAEMDDMEEEEEEEEGDGWEGRRIGLDREGVVGKGGGRRPSADRKPLKTCEKDTCRAFLVADCIGPEETVDVPVVLRARYHSVALAASSLGPSPFVTPQTTTSPLSNEVMLLMGYRSASAPPPPSASVLRSHEGTQAPGMQKEEDPTASRTLTEKEVEKVLQQEEESPPHASPHPPDEWHTTSQSYPFSQGYFFHSQPTGRGAKKKKSHGAGGSTPCFPLIPIHAVVLHRVHRRIRVAPLLSIYASVLPPVWNGVVPPSSLRSSPTDTTLFSPVVSLAVKNTMQGAGATSFFSASSSSRFSTASNANGKDPSDRKLFVTSVVASHGREWKVSSLTNSSYGFAEQAPGIPTTNTSSFSSAFSQKERWMEKKKGNAFPMRIRCGGAHALLFQLERQRDASESSGALLLPSHRKGSFAEGQNESERMDQRSEEEKEVKVEVEENPLVSTPPPPPSEKTSHLSPLVAVSPIPAWTTSSSYRSTAMSHHSQSDSLDDGQSERTRMEDVQEGKRGNPLRKEFPCEIIEEAFSSCRGDTYGSESVQESEERVLIHGFDPILDEPASTRQFLLFSSVRDVGRMAGEESEMVSSSFSPFAARGPARGMSGGLSFYRDGGSKSSAHTLSMAKKETTPPERTTRRKEIKNSPPSLIRTHAESEKGGRSPLHATDDPSAWDMHLRKNNKEDKSEAALYGRRLERYAPIVFTVYWAIKEEKPRRSSISDDTPAKKEEEKEEASRPKRPQCAIRRGRLYFWVHPLSFLSVLHPLTSSRCMSWQRSSVVEGPCTGTVVPSLLSVVREENLLPRSMDEEDSWQVVAARRHQQRWLCRAMLQEVPFSAYLSLGSRSGYWGAIAYGISFPPRDAVSSATLPTHGSSIPIFSIYSPYFRPLHVNDALEHLDPMTSRGKEVAVWEEGAETAHGKNDDHIKKRKGIIPASIGLSSFSPMPILVDVCVNVAVVCTACQNVPLSFSPPVDSTVRSTAISEEVVREPRSSATPLGGKAKKHGTYWTHRIIAVRSVEEKVQNPAESVFWGDDSGTSWMRVCHSSPVASVVILPGESVRIPVEMTVLSEEIVKRMRTGSPKKGLRGEEVEHPRSNKEMNGQFLTAVNPNIFYLTVRPLIFPSSPDRLFSGMTRKELLESFPSRRDAEEDNEEEESLSLKAMRDEEEDPSSSSAVSSYSLGGKKKVKANNGSSSTVRRMTLSSSENDPFSSTARFVDRSEEEKPIVSPVVAPTLPTSGSLSLQKRAPSSMRSDSPRVGSFKGSGKSCSLFDRGAFASFSPSQFFIINANPCSTILFDAFKEEEKNKISTEKRGLDTYDLYFSSEKKSGIAHPFSYDVAALFASTEDCCREVIHILDESPRNSSPRNSSGPFSLPDSSFLASHRDPLQTENEQVSFFGALHELSDLLYF